MRLYIVLQITPFSRLFFKKYSFTFNCTLRDLFFFFNFWLKIDTWKIKMTKVSSCSCINFKIKKTLFFSLYVDSISIPYGSKKVEQRSQVAEVSKFATRTGGEMAIKLNYSPKLVTAQKFGFSSRGEPHAKQRFIIFFERNSLTSILILFLARI